MTTTIFSRTLLAGALLGFVFAAVPVLADTDDYLKPVRPIGVDGQVSWNDTAIQFTYAPTFGFGKLEGAANYRFTLTDERNVSHSFVAAMPNAALSPVWGAVPQGMCALKVEALGDDGRVLGVAGERKFRKMPPFCAGKYPKATMPYDEAAWRILAYVFRRPYLQYLLDHSRPDASYPLNSYPSKMLSAQILGMIRYAELCPENRERALKTVRLNADWLIQRAEPAGSPLAHFTATYDGRGEAGNGYLGEKWRGQHMLHYPATAAQALLAAWRATGETKYRDFAIKIADTYLRLQGEDGTWWQKMDGKTGKPVADNRLVPVRVIPMLEEVAKLTGEAKYRMAAERAFAYVEKGPMRDWAWDAQFEDIVPVPRYANLSKYGPCDTLLYLLKRFPGDRRRIAECRELLRFSEDQFVVWEAPHLPKWTTPVVLEQYHCYLPIDESVAKLLSAYLAMYKATGNPTDLAKARALGDAMTRELKEDGRLRTWWDDGLADNNEDKDWMNGQIADAFALEELAGVASVTVSVDFDTEVGKVRPQLHSASFGPTIANCHQPEIDDILAMGLYGARTHDWSLSNPNQRVCDWHHIFPLVERDAKDPANYHFAPTDYLLKRTREETKLDVFFRLGTSIEHTQCDYHFNANVPKDFDKVAEVFAATVRHYNRGWANGFNWGIKYWEIWNEPDGITNMWFDRELSKDWRGGPGAEKLMHKFADMFAKCLKRLKDEFGDTIKVGGPALMWMNETYFTALKEECDKLGVKPDFISWHRYIEDPQDGIDSVAKARSLCDRLGWKGCELVLNEWHYFSGSDYNWSSFSSSVPSEVKKVWEGPRSHNGIDSSCFNLALLAQFQYTDLAMANYYGWNRMGNWGYMDHHRQKYKTYYGLCLFGDFLKTGCNVLCKTDRFKGEKEQVVAVVAAKSKDGKRRAFVVSDYRVREKEIVVELKGVPADAKIAAEIHDYTRNREKADFTFKDGKLTLTKPDAESAAWLVTIE